MDYLPASDAKPVTSQIVEIGTLDHASLLPLSLKLSLFTPPEVPQLPPLLESIRPLPPPHKPLFGSSGANQSLAARIIEQEKLISFFICIFENVTCVCHLTVYPSVCFYVCVYVYLFIYMFINHSVSVYVCTRMYVRINVRMYVLIFVPIYISNTCKKG